VPEKPQKPLMIQAGGISQEELKNAIVKYSKEGKSLVDQVLTDESVSEEGLAESISIYGRFARVNLPAAEIDPEAVKMMPQETARKNLCIPIRVEGRQMLVAMANPADYRAVQEVEFRVGRTVKPMVCTRSEVLDAIEKYYEPDVALRAFTENLEEAKDISITAGEKEADVDLSRSLTSAELPPVIKVVNLIIQDGITQRATDIHIEPTLNDLQVRIRVDGVLRPLMQLPKWLTNPICSRLKVLSRLDIAERRLPQDGRLKVHMAGQAFDFRMSTLPTLFGEKIVMRILASASQLPTLEKLALNEEDRRTLLAALMQPQGLILVTGPTGSGKSSTLTACLGHRKSPELNIITVEDPVEYQIPGINQVQVNSKTGLTFAAALRSILRQDPDVVLVGEMRDLETTEIAFHASMTGHLVLSTLHTNSAIASLARLLDLGVDPALISTAVTLIIAQRLLRKLCQECKQPYDPPTWMLNKLGVAKDNTVYYKPVGCSKCGGTGFAGRMAVLEFLPINKRVREMIVNKSSENEIRAAMRTQGMRFLLDRGLEMVRKGATDIGELFRVLQLEDEVDVMSSRCPKCKANVEARFTICPNCLTVLNQSCHNCRQQLKSEWKVCPYCQTPVQGEAAAPPAALPEASQPPPPRYVAIAASEMAAVPAGAEETAPAKEPTILIVDDDDSIRLIVKRSLEQLPFPIKTQTASNGIEALQMAGESHPDLILLDIMMPGMDGFTVCQKLRSQVATAFIPIMMLTANASEEGLTRGFLAGTDDYVAKPFSIPELNARVTRLLRRTYGII